MKPNGHIAIPLLMKLRNIASGMHDYRCDRGFFLMDPMQLLAARTSVPFSGTRSRESTPRIRH